MPDLIRFIHKSSMGMSRIIKTFRTHWGAKYSTGSPNVKTPLLSKLPNQLNTISTPSRTDSTTPKGTKASSPFQEYESASGISKRQLEKKIQAIAIKEVRAPVFRPVWYVHEEVLKQYGLDLENFTALVPNGSPTLLSAKSVDHTHTPPSSVSPDPANHSAKRKGKSLLQFLTRSPLDKSQLPSPKRPKVETECGHHDVVIVDPPPSASSGASADEVLAEPLAKRACLDGTSTSTRDDSASSVSFNSGSKTLADLLLVVP